MAQTIDSGELATDIPIFSAALACAARTDHDLENLAYFGLRDALCVPVLSDRPREAQEVIDEIEAQIAEETVRLRAVGIDGRWVIGVPRRALPVRTHEELWIWLEERAQREDVVGVGPIDVARGGREPDLIARHAAIRRGSGRGLVLAHLADDARAADVERFAAAAADADVDSSELLLVGVSFLTARALLVSGLRGAIEVGPTGASPEVAAELLRRFSPRSFRRLGLGGTLGAGPSDVTGLARTLSLLRRAAVLREQIEAVAGGNLRAWLDGS